jgi:hypothetical protein
LAARLCEQRLLIVSGKICCRRLETDRGVTCRNTSSQFEQETKTLDATIARLQAERDKSRELLARLINNIETGTRESIVQCIDECKRALMIS